MLAEKQQHINGTDAWKLYIARGGSTSYPTFIKLMKKLGLAVQATGKYGSYSINSNQFDAWLRKVGKGKAHV